MLDKIWDEVFAGPQPVNVDIPAKSRPGVDIPSSPTSAFERTDSSSSPLPSPGPSDESASRRASVDLKEAASVSHRIRITNGPPRRVSLDTARSLPSHFYAPEILSPGSRKDENVWRSVFHPGSNKAGMERLGSQKFDKADAKGPSVYDWYNPLTT
jgi:hypothetical protein